jgi:hypothetical protein
MDLDRDALDGEDIGILANESVPPWEQPGCFRLDCEPHRGELLKAIASVSVAVSFISICPLTYIALILALPLSLSIWLLARHDLALMRKGKIDPHGEGLTDGARRLSFGAFVAAVIVSAFWGSILLIFLLGQ